MVQFVQVCFSRVLLKPNYWAGIAIGDRHVMGSKGDSEEQLVCVLPEVGERLTHRETSINPGKIQLTLIQSDFDETLIRLCFFAGKLTFGFLCEISQFVKG